MSMKPKRTLIAYCVLAERLRTPGMGIMRALTPFFAEACAPLAGQLFDGATFSDAVASNFGITIPRLAALGLADQLAQEGLLIPHAGSGNGTVYRYGALPAAVADSASPLTENEVEAVITSFIHYAKEDEHLSGFDEAALQAAFLERLLNADSMRILGRREGSISTKATAKTLTVVRKDLAKGAEAEDLHLDFLVSQFLLDLREKDPTGFERVSAVAFANMAAEAVACFRDPPEPGSPLDSLTVFLDSPLLLDMLGVNLEYADYGQELLDVMRRSGARAAVFEHSVAEAESAIYAQLQSLRSGINRFSASWGTSPQPDHLASLVGNVAERSEKRLGIQVLRDPDIGLHRRSEVAVGNIESEINNRMQGWRNADAREHDRKSIWSLISLRQDTQLCERVCDSTWLLLTRNTTLVTIANNSWRMWLSDAKRHGRSWVERWAPVAMSDKQFAGYLWARTGGGDRSISVARLLAHCSAAVRPRADVKAKAYNLVLELHGQALAEDVAALLEDREGSRAVMRATHGDPEDVTPERLPLIMERVKLAAGEFAAAQERATGEQRLQETRAAHSREIDSIKASAAEQHDALGQKAKQAEVALRQKHLDEEQLKAQNERLMGELSATAAAERTRRRNILEAGLAAGVSRYKLCRRSLAFLFGLGSGGLVLLAVGHPEIAAGLTVLTTILGLSFVPEFLKRPLRRVAMRRVWEIVEMKDATVEMPKELPDFEKGAWEGLSGNAPEVKCIGRTA